MRTLICFIAFVVGCQSLLAQSDSTKVLDELIVSAYRADRSLLEVPASIGVVSTQQFNRFNNTSFLPAVNIVPGVRMEERSPGSYRFAIRGSSLRSPFGVRNVKFYWNGLPLTDGGGNTYLNLIDLDAVGKMEIIKGPGASLYGAGTGGVVLLNTPDAEKQFNLSASMVGGSYGLFRFQAGVTALVTKKSDVQLRLGSQGSNGYRQQTAMSRFSTGIDWNYHINSRNSIATTVLTSMLNYETPGGLTEAQYADDPRQARPATATLPGAVEQKAAVTNNTVYAATMYEHDWSGPWTTRVGLFASNTEFENPTIRNYELRSEQNWGGRTETQVRVEGRIKTKISFGAEYQNFFSPLSVYANNGGNKGNLQQDDELQSRTGLLFAQSELELPRNFFATVGASTNFLRYQFKRTSVEPAIEQQRNFDVGFFPRIALLKKIRFVSVFASVSDGFSPPSLAEVRPSTGNFNNTLKAERGLNYEGGIRGSVLQNRLKFEATRYYFYLRNAIVIQRTPDNADYFVNAGKTRQSGTEVNVTWQPRWETAFVRSLNLTLSGTHTEYYFDDYVQDGVDFSGNKLTGVAPGYLSLLLDVGTKVGFYMNTTVNYSEHTPLNDANTFYASSFWLLGARAGYKTRSTFLPFEVFAGIDNAFDKKYSLGNDLNAAGNRFFNAAMGRNYYAGLRISLH